MSLNKTEPEPCRQHSVGARPKLWSKPYILTLFTLFSASITMSLLMPLLPIYIEMIGGNISLAGLAVSIYTFMALISRPVFAILIDRYRRKPILVIGFVLIFIGCFSYRFVTLIGVLLIVRAVHGMGYSASTNAAVTIAADIVPRERRSQGIGYYGFVSAASLALGPATGLLIFKSADIKTAFTAAAALTAAGLIAACFISHEEKSSYQRAQADTEKPLTYTNPAGTAPKQLKLNFGYEKTALPASVVMLFIAFANSGIVTYLPTYAGALGLGDISLYFVIYAVALLITRIIVDSITKTRDISVVLLPGIALMSMAFILLGAGRTLSCFLTAAVFYGVGYGSVQPTLNTIVISLCAPSKRGAANSTFFSAMDLGIGLGALLWGIASQAFGYPVIYFGCFACTAFAAIALALFNKKKSKRAVGQSSAGDITLNE